ncbi:MAG: CAP domain-containing protein [Methanocella sp.]
MNKTRTTQVKVMVRGAAVVVALAALLALAPAVEAASFTYTTSWGTVPVVWQGWGYYLTKLWNPAPAPAPAPKPAPAPTPTPAPAPAPAPAPTPAPAPKPAPAPAPAPAPTPSGYQVSAAEKHAVDLVNADRAKNGLPALTLNAELTRVAHIKAQDMADNGYFDHNSPTYGSPFNMMTKFGIKYTAAGENIAKASSVDQSEQLFMNSSGHRANILSSSYTQVGIGVYVGSDGMTYVSQMFIHP